MVATLSRIPPRRITPNITRMAKSDGIIVISRAAPLRKTTTKVMKMIATVRREALDQRRHQVLAHLGLERAQADRLQLERP